MEDYERRKLYRVHLKNISEIRNCRTPINYTAYSSRLFNFSLKTTFRKRELKSLNKQNHSRLMSEKKNEERRTCDYFRTRENSRLEQRLNKASGSINMQQYEKEYDEHKKIMKLHRKVKQFKRVILYKIYDITFKGKSPNLNEDFKIYDLSEDKDQHRKEDNNNNHKSSKTYDLKNISSEKYKESRIEQSKQIKDEELMRGNIFQLRNLMIRGFRDEKLVFKIVGREQGTATIINGQKMVPIMHRKEIVGTLILEVC